MAFEWRKTGRVVDASGTTITYEAEGCNWIIESRKRHIEHVNGVGTWDYTTYSVVMPATPRRPAYNIVVMRTLAAAKDFVERKLGGTEAGNA